MSGRAAVVGAVAWALGFLVSAVALRGNPIGDWIEGALLAAWIVFVALAFRSAPRDRTTGRRQEKRKTAGGASE
jgi:membrane-associated phospholipid phosphatase